MATLTVRDPMDKLEDSAERSTAELVARAKAIIAGRLPPPAMDTPAFIAEHLEKEFAGYEPPPTVEAIRRIANQSIIQHIYSGTPVLSLILPGDCRAVLAAGEKDIWALLAGLSHAEIAKVVLETTEGY